MKRKFFVLMMVCTSLTGLSQKGSWYIGGVAGYGSNSQEPEGGTKTVTNTWAFGPEVGTFLKNDLQLGFILGLNGSTEKDDDDKVYESSSFSPTIYIRKFKKMTDNFSLFTGLYVNYISGTQKEFDPDEELKGTGFGVSLGVGMAYALSSRWTAVGQYGLLGYSSVKYERDGADYGTENDFNFGVNTVGSSNFVQGNGSGAVFNIGLYYTFRP